MCVVPTLFDVLRKVTEQRLPPVGMIQIDGDRNPPVLDIRDVITRCENIEVCPSKAVYLRIDFGAGGATFFVYERPEEGYFD